MSEGKIPEFIEQAEIGDRDAHFKVMVEEMGELSEALNEDDRAAQAEELADLRVTVEVMAELLGVDLDAAFEKKMEYNLRKTASKTEGGKVVDDADVEKPDF